MAVLPAKLSPMLKTTAGRSASRCATSAAPDRPVGTFWNGKASAL